MSSVNGLLLRSVRTHRCFAASHANDISQCKFSGKSAMQPSVIQVLNGGDCAVCCNAFQTIPFPAVFSDIT